MGHSFTSHSRVSFEFIAVVCSVLVVATAAPAAAQENPRSAATASSAPAAAKPDKALRIFLKTGAKKTYIRGYQWMTLNLNRKINLVESARRGALKMGAVMTLPAERYVDEVNRFFQNNPALSHMELGQVIQGIAISIKDWEQGGRGDQHAAS